MKDALPVPLAVVDVACVNDLSFELDVEVEEPDGLSPPLLELDGNSEKQMLEWYPRLLQCWHGWRFLQNFVK